jgi:hypothetical protein
LQKSKYEKTYKISRTKLRKKLQQHQFAANSFESRFKIVYKDKTQDFTGNGKIKILKDSIIWGSINFMGIPMAKFYITPNKIQYYNKINKEYYDGNYDFIRNEFGISLNFKHLQNLLLGDLLDSKDLETYRLKRKRFYYLLYNHVGGGLDSIQISPFFKILSEKLQYQKHSAKLTYTGYQKIQNENLPGQIFLKTNSGLNLIIEYKHPVTNKKLRFPFSIPKDYTPLSP